MDVSTSTTSLGAPRRSAHDPQAAQLQVDQRVAVTDDVADVAFVPISARLGDTRVGTPTRLLLGWSSDRPLHVLIADDAGGAHYVITVDEPPPSGRCGTASLVRHYEPVAS